jgi:hypothetical protein
MPCVNLLVFSAGCSQDAETSYQSSVVNKIKNEIVQSSTTDVSTRISNYQSIFIENNGTWECDTLNIGNSITSNTQIYNNVTDDQAAQIVAAFKQQVGTDVQTMATQDADTFTSIFGKQPNGTSVSDVTQSLTNNFESLVSASAIKSVMNQISNSQDIKIINNGRMGGTLCNINNTILQTVTIQNVVKTVQDGLLQSQTWQDVQTNIETTASGTSGSGGSSTIFLIIAGVIAAAVVLVAVIRAISGSNKKKKAATAQAAAAAAPPPAAPYYPPPYPYPPPVEYAPSQLPATASQATTADRAVRA